MKALEKTEHIQLDDVTLKVADCSAAIQETVAFIDHLRQQEHDLKVQIDTLSYAMYGIQQKLVQLINEERAASTEPAPTEETVEEAQPVKAPKKRSRSRN